LAAPTHGAAWGDDLVPYSDTIEIVGGFMPRGSTDGPVEALTISPSDPVTLQFVYTNVSTQIQRDVRMLYSRFDSEVLVAIDPTASLTVADEVTEGTEALGPLLEETGFLLGDIEPQGSATLRIDFVPADGLCGEIAASRSIRVVSGNGDRRELEAGLTVEAAPCE
jgi:hypothetical protein